MPEAKKRGYVYIVGAGPGDYGLLTLKGLECIEKSDVIIYDRLINEKFLGRAMPAAELIYAGKRSSEHVMAQSDINELIASRALEGKIVTRLKGGDPYIFGRGSEEALVLYEKGIEFEVVPGVSAFASVPAYAGIPVTHRGVTSSATVITGHEDPGKESSGIDWAKLAGAGTLVFFMGVKNLAHICEKLLKNGMPKDTPAALIQRGTTALQKSLTSTLGEIETAAEREKIAPPAILVVGHTVSFGDRLNWFEKRPLFGKKILVTRAREQASELSCELEALGAMVYEAPMISIKPPSDNYSSFKLALDSIEKFDIITFTSVNGVNIFLGKLQDFKKDIRCLAGLKIAAIGEKTAEALRRHYISVDIVPDTYKAEELADKIKECAPVKCARVLIARAENAREILVEKLSAAGFFVSVASLYKTEEAPDAAVRLEKALADGVDLITFASSSTVDNFVKACGAGVLKALTANGKAIFAAIGPVTAQTCSKYSIPVEIMPEKYTIKSLVGKICERFSK